MHDATLLAHALASDSIAVSESMPGETLVSRSGAGWRWTLIRRHAPPGVDGDDMLHIALAPHLMDGARADLSGDHVAVAVRDPAQVRDSTLETLGHSLLIACQNEDDPLIGESLAVAVAARLLRHDAGEDRTSVPTGAVADAVADSIDYMGSHLAERISLEDLARVAYMSRFHFLRCFKGITGTTPIAYLRGVRLERAAARLAVERTPVAVVAAESGYSHAGRFAADFRTRFGVMPSEHRRRALRGSPPLRR